VPTRLSHEEIDDTRERESPDVTSTEKIRNYVAGDQVQVLSADQKKILGKRVSNVTADNVLKLIVSTAAARLEFKGWTVNSDPVHEFLSMMFLTSRMAKLQYDTHFALLRDGNTALSLRWKGGGSPGDGRVTVHRENWWDGIEGTFLAYDEFDEPLWAVRDFFQYENGKQVSRRVIYYPDAIYRYRRESGGWKPWNLPGEEFDQLNPGVVPWVKRDGSPLGIPIVHFPNCQGDEGLYGRSDVWGLLGIQDDLNSIQDDIAAAAMFTGFQMYWATGVAESQGSKNKVSPGSLLTSTNPDSRFGTLPPGSMEALTEAHGYKRQTVAVDSATPLHLITGGDWPSGEALIRAEMPLIDKAYRLARVQGPSWVLVGHRATEMANAFGGQSLDEDEPISAIFAPPERFDELTEVQVKQARVNLYASASMLEDRIALEKTELFTQEEVNQMMNEREQRASAFMSPVAEF
jgi:Phage portal protein, SPP1 Gp6-like